MGAQPSREREDLRYGDPHGRGGPHNFYGPDRFDVQRAKVGDGKEPLESHGFYLAHEEAPPPTLWQKVRSWFERDRKSA